MFTKLIFKLTAFCETISDAYSTVTGLLILSPYCLMIYRYQDEYQTRSSRGPNYKL